MKSSLILVNPWIYDFAAYDLWSKPLGLLYLAGYLGYCGFQVHLIDCLDVHHPGMKNNTSMKRPVRRLYGTGKFWRQEVSRPAPLKGIPKTYSRYGLSPEAFTRAMSEVRRPEAILVTSLMTYWYPGVQAVVDIAKKVHPGVPVVLGGIYAGLCNEHALKNSGADYVITERDPVALLKCLNEYGIVKQGPISGSACRPYPGFDLLSRIDYICLMTSAGCPYHCRYCASRFLNPEFIQRDPKDVLDEILHWHKRFGVSDFAFYDDALLVGSEAHLTVLLEDLARLDLGLRFHTPNAIHIKNVTTEIADLMHRAGFQTIRLGLETSDLSIHSKLDNKVASGDFEKAVCNLFKAGFAANEIGAYILIGLPGQSVDSVVESLDLVEKEGIAAYLSEYSPIPHTALWEKAVACSRYDLSSEPLFHNNTLLPCWNEDQLAELPGFKRRVSELRRP